MIRAPSLGSDQHGLWIPLPGLLKYVDNNKINYTYRCFLANFPQKKEPNKQTNKKNPNGFLQKAAVRNLNRLICYPKRGNEHFEGIILLFCDFREQRAIAGRPLADKLARCSATKQTPNVTSGITEHHQRNRS